MPTVPRRGVGYTPTQPLPSERVPSGAFQSPAPVDISPLARGLGQYVADEKRKQDEIAILEADNKLGALETDLTTKASQFRGKDALQAAPAVQADWQQSTDEIRQGLTNDDQRMAFEKRAAGRYQSLRSNVAQHTDAELKRYDLDTTTAGVKTALNDAIQNFEDPRKIERSVADSQAIIDKFADRNGWSPEKRKEVQADAVSSIHSGVLTRLADSGQDLTAKQYFNDHKTEIQGNDLLQAQRMISAGSIRGESQRQADKILAKKDLNLTEAVAEARAITDPEVRDAIEQRIRADFAERANNLRAEREQVMTAATNIVERTRDFNSIPTSLVATMDVNERKSLRSYADELNGKGAGGIKTDLSTFYNLETMATTPETRDKFLELDLNQYKSKLSPSDFEEMAKLQGSSRKGDAAAEAKLQWTQSKHQIIGSVMNSALIGITKKGKVKDVAARASFRSAVDAEVSRIQSATNKPVTLEQVKQIANELATQHVVERPGMLWGTNQEEVRTFQMRPGEKVILDIKDVPAGQRAQIQAALQQRGRPVTDAAIVDWYRRYIQSLAPEPE